MVGSCECCKRRGESRLYSAAKYGQRTATRLCNGCATEGHYADFCLACTTGAERIWYCQRMAHMSAAHAGLLTRMLNDQGDPEAKARATVKVPDQYQIGELRF